MTYLRAHAEVAERVLLPGDPGRALRLAQQLVDAPKMLNHHRGLWGYTGIAPDGEPLTIQSTGLGGPSTAIVVEELIALGARRLVRAGTCSALVDAELGSLVIAESVLPHDGASRALGADGALVPDPELLAALRAAGNGAVVGPVVSADLLDGDPWASSGARRPRPLHRRAVRGRGPRWCARRVRAGGDGRADRARARSSAPRPSSAGSRLRRSKPGG